MTDDELIAVALRIQGWRREDEMRWLCDVLWRKPHMAVIEVGAWKGRTTKILVHKAAGLTLAVDTWLGSDSGARTRDATKKIVEEAGDDAIYAEFWGNLREEILDSRVIPIRASSQNAVGIITHALECLEVPGADLIFIDADHSYEAVAADITAYVELLCAGGILCGDDYHDHWPGVVKAVDELLPAHKLGPGAIWYWEGR